MRSITASHCRWHRGNRWGGARRHHESLSCVQLEPVASVSFLESVSIITRGQFEDGWVGIYVSCEGLFFKRLLCFAGRGDTHINCSPLTMRTGTHGVVPEGWILWKTERWKMYVCTNRFSNLSEMSTCYTFHFILFFFRFVVYLLPSGRCFLSNFLFF